jgi:hypothetical protein
MLVDSPRPLCARAAPVHPLAYGSAVPGAHGPPAVGSPASRQHFGDYRPGFARDLARTRHGQSPAGDPTGPCRCVMVVQSSRSSANCLSLPWTRDGRSSIPRERVMLQPHPGSMADARTPDTELPSPGAIAVITLHCGIRYTFGTLPPLSWTIASSRSPIVRRSRTSDPWWWWAKSPGASRRAIELRQNPGRPSSTPLVPNNPGQPGWWRLAYGHSLELSSQVDSSLFRASPCDH